MLLQNPKSSALPAAAQYESSRRANGLARFKWTVLIVPLVGLVAVSAASTPQATPNRTSVPRAWEGSSLANMELPGAALGKSPSHVPADYYYKLPVVQVYRSYPVYAPGREPKGYMAWLKRQDPQIAFNPARLKTEADLVRAGEVVFDDPTGVWPLEVAPDAAFIRQAGIPVAKDGTLPFFRYVIREKGKVEFGDFSCANCHTRVMPDGSVLKGAQGNFPWDRYYVHRRRKLNFPEAVRRNDDRAVFAAPWLGEKDPNARLVALSLSQTEAMRNAVPAGVIARHGASLFAPVKVPDLIGVRDRKYLDSTGLLRHRSVTDLMRYAAFNTGLDFGSQYGEANTGFLPITAFVGGTSLPAAPPDFGPRYSDEQLFALATYLYALKPPANPHRKDALARRGEAVFAREGCASCHAPPLYTNNKLTLASGFTLPQGHPAARDVMPVSVGTDPSLALYSRRGTGLYKVPSLRGVWYRGMFGHDGSCATLEDWFDARRLKADYVPTGFRGYGVKSRAVPGHEFGLSLPPKDKAALIAFLKTL